MNRRTLLLGGLASTLAGCANPNPPMPALVDAFQGIYKANAASVPADVPVTLAQPVGLITSENVERYIGAVRDTNEYWGQRVPASLTNTVAMADNDPMYFAGRLLAMLKGHFPSISKVHDFRDAAAKGKKGVILVDIILKPGEPFGDRTTRVDIDAYFFDMKMDPVSKLRGHGENYVPYASMDGRIQKSIDAALAQLDGKIRAMVRKQ